MKYLEKPKFSHPSACPYIEGEEYRQEYFLAYDVNEVELDELFEAGWRRFGAYFFRPACRFCRKCIPIRTVIPELNLSKSQRRVMKKNADTRVIVNPLRYDERHFEIYKKHSLIKFHNEEDEEAFKQSFYLPAAPCGIIEYYRDNILVAFGFLDFGKESLSSVYFVYDPDYSQYSLGSFSVITEIKLGQKWGKRHYNLGFWIKENRSMSYKDRFKPCEIMDWDNYQWNRLDEVK
ncbi:arginyltransferase [Spirochaeta cellobiosiphila]|uniref:arginyltransferase n=1 Tax=Spirochaeta cellobiosiphila TaxID=504483 RepID=UPI0004149002|nr:arginyltransferase [Spirochaeta cellobiosiphila]